MTDYQRFKRTNLFKNSQKEIKTLGHIIAVELFSTLEREYYLWKYFKSNGDFLFEKEVYHWMPDPRRSVLIELK
jgi:hypothetical protein